MSGAPHIALRFDGVDKRYPGSARKALDGLSFEVPAGSICGFVGPNGAGKTTAYSVVSGFLPPDAGTVDILGLGPFDPWTMKGRLGVLPQDAELPGRHSPIELLEHLGRLQGLDPARAKAEAVEQVERVRLGDRGYDPIQSLSHGMRRRVAVATALLGTPELVLLDEPTAGLDPVQTRSLREALRALRGRTTLVVSSHNLLELEQICDWVVMLDQGRCLRQGSVAAVTGQSERVVWSLTGPWAGCGALAAALSPHTLWMEGDDLCLRTSGPAAIDELIWRVWAELVQQRVPVREMRRGVSLEQRFVDDAGA
jgi:ABC-2 type transport system ATP-binding protein